MTNSQNVNVTVYTKHNVLLKTFSMRKGGNLWVWLRKNGLPIGSACSGVGVCGACHVHVYRPDEEGHAHFNNDDACNNEKSISSQSAFEQSTLKRNGKNPEKQRLACLTRIYSDIAVTANYW